MQQCADDASTSREVAAASIEASGVSPGARVEPLRVQILEVVANIQTRTLKTEVEKGSM